MKRRSFIGAAFGLFGGWMFGPKVFGTAKPLSGKLPEPYEKYTYDHTLMIKGEQWDVYEFICFRDYVALKDHNNDTWLSNEPVQVIFRVIHRNGTILNFFQDVVPNQIIKMRHTIFRHNDHVITFKGMRCLENNYTKRLS